MIEDQEILAAVESQADTARDVLRFVHAHPELAHEEHACSDHLATTLERAGFAVERGVGQMPTAFRATFTGARTGRSVGIVTLYDAVPAVRPDGAVEPVHSCGHGPMSGGVIAAALALAGLGDGLAGTVSVVGCPADEIHAPATVTRGGGKALSVAAGLWDDIDVALYAHPEFIDTVSLESLWMRRESATVSGARSLRADARPAPIVAFQALASLLDELPPARVMVETLTLDGDVEECAGLVLRATFLVFADDEEGIAAAAGPLRAALPNAHWELGPVYMGVRPDRMVTAEVAAAFAAAGRDFVADPPPLPFATDFGNISQHVPAALIGVGRPGGWGFHTDDGAKQFAGPHGEEVSLGIARVIALSAARLTERP